MNIPFCHRLREEGHTYTRASPILTTVGCHEILNREVVAVVKMKDGRGTGGWEAVRMMNEQLGGSGLGSSVEWSPRTQE